MIKEGGGLPKEGGGLPHVKKYLQKINDFHETDSGDDGDDESEDEGDYEGDEDELEVAYRQLEARNWRDEDEEYLKWYLETVLTDKQETIVRLNEEPRDMMNLIKSFI